MVELKINRTTLLAVLGALALAAAFGLGIWLSGNVGQQAAAPAAEQPAANVAQQPVQPEANPNPPGAAVGDPAAASDPNVDPVLAGGELTAEQDAAVERISIEDALPKLGSADVVWVDTRTSGEYAESHIEGAVSYPAYEQDTRLSELPQDKEIIAYCA